MSQLKAEKWSKILTNSIEIHFKDKNNIYNNL